MVDCGEATQHQMMRSKTSKMGRIELILVTHLHGDHFFGIFGMLATLGTHGRTQPVTVVGPRGIKNAIDSVFIAGETEGEAPYPIKVIELDTSFPTILPCPTDEAAETPLTLASDVGVDVVAVPIEHRIPCVAYILRERSKQGALDANKAKSLGASGKLLGRLKAGENVELPDGTVVMASDVAGPPVLGRKLAIVQDTHDPSKFGYLFDDTDVMIHEATYDHSLVTKAVDCGHSTPTMAADFAMKHKTKNLILTHFSSRYDKEILVKEGDRVLFSKPKCVQNRELYDRLRAREAEMNAGDSNSDRVGDRNSNVDMDVAVGAVGIAADADTNIVDAFLTAHKASKAGSCCGSTVANAAMSGKMVCPETGVAVDERLLDTLSVYDLQKEAEEYVKANQGKPGYGPLKVFTAADFRVFESDKNGTWLQIEEADVDLTKMY